MAPIEAIYQDGVFKPLNDLELPENQRVELSVRLLDTNGVQAWLERVRQRQERFVAQRGCLSDSALDIAEDRRR